MSLHLSSPRASYTAVAKVAATPLLAPIAALAAPWSPHTRTRRVCDWPLLTPHPSLPVPTPPLTGARLAACGGQERDGAGALPRPPSPPPLALHILNNVMVKYPLTLHRWHTQEQRLRLVVAKKLVSKKAEQVLRSRARGPVCGLSVPPCPSAHLEPPHPGAPRAPGHIGASPSIPDARHDSGYRPGLYPYLGPRSLRSAQQVRHVPSPQRVSQHEQEGTSSGAEEGPGSSGAKAGGAAGVR